jgi:micrococcal nuclease
MRRWLPIVFTTLILMVAPAAACDLESGGSFAVARVADGETLVLDDGREVRLIGALSPRPHDADAEALFWQPAVDAKVALEKLVAGRTVEIGFIGRRQDRNGRLLAHVFVAGPPSADPTAPIWEPSADPTAPIWVQGHMLDQGHARAYALPGNAGCLETLLAFEAGAMAARRGLWASAAYAVRAADIPAPLLAQRDRYHVIEGVVTTASDVRGQVYVNFGADWRTDFTVLLRPAERRAFATRGVDAASLTGARVRVRGWIGRRNGPFIEIVDALEIEMIEQPPTASETPPRPANAVAPRSRTARLPQLPATARQ